MGDMENEAEFYYEKLKAATDSGKVLREFFRAMTGKDTGRTEIIMINRLIKMFGRFTVYFGIMDLSRYPTEKLIGDLYPLLYTICKSRFEKIHTETFSVSHESLDKYLKEIQKEREKAQRSKGKLPSSEGL